MKDRRKLFRLSFLDIASLQSFQFFFLLTIPATPFSVLTSEPLVQLSERFTAVALDAVLGHQLFERRSDLRERHFVFIDTAFG